MFPQSDAPELLSWIFFGFASFTLLYSFRRVYSYDEVRPVRQLAFFFLGISIFFTLHAMMKESKKVAEKNLPPQAERAFSQ